MSKDRGQGLNHALQDAHNLVSALTSHQTPEFASALQSYAEEVVKRGAEEVVLSRQNALMVLDWKLLEQSPVFKHSLDRSPVTGSDEQQTAEQHRSDMMTKDQVGSVERKTTAIAGA